MLTQQQKVELQTRAELQMVKAQGAIEFVETLPVAVSIRPVVSNHKATKTYRVLQPQSHKKLSVGAKLLVNANKTHKKIKVRGLRTVVLNTLTHDPSIALTFEEIMKECRFSFPKLSEVQLKSSLYGLTGEKKIQKTHDGYFSAVVQESAASKTIAAS